jgi:hypothetical protein
MPHLQSEAVTVMTNALRRVESSIAPPQPVPHKDSFVFRYANKGIHEALVQKLARYISGLNAVAVLLDAGYIQEVGILFRTLDEIQEDIFFLASAETNGAWSERHAQYLEAFYAEVVFSRPESSLRISKPSLPSRKKVRTHTMNALGQGVNVSQALDAGESVSTAYSGYVHAASENIMEMYGGNPPHFHVQGMPGTPCIATFEWDAENYVYRGLMAATVVAKAFRDKPLVDVMYEFLEEYESANAPNKGGDA